MMRILLAVLAVAAGGCADKAPVLESSDPVIQEILTKYKPSLALQGDAARGREIFGKSCLHCHRMGAEGHQLGPDASAFRTRLPEQLLLDIVDPSREVKPEYLSVRILTTDGQLIDGMLANEDESRVTINRASGC